MVRYLDNNQPSGFGAWAASKDAQKSGKANTWLYWILLAALAWLIVSWVFPSEKKAPAIQPAEMPTAEIVSEVPPVLITGENLSAAIRGIRISNIELLNYKAEQPTTNNRQPVALLAQPNEFIEVGFSGSGVTFPTAQTKWKVYDKNNEPQDCPSSEFATAFCKEGGTFISKVMDWTSPEEVIFTRVITFYPNNMIRFEDTVHNESKNPISVSIYARVARAEGGRASAGVRTGGIAFTDGSIEREDWSDMSKRQYSFSANERNPGFIGFTDQYWQTILHIQKGEEQTMRFKQRSDGMFQADIAQEVITLASGASHGFSTAIYAGPKTQEALQNAANAIPGIDQTIDYGWFWFLSKPFLWAMNSLHKIVGNYGIAIIFLTIILRILMWPLTRKSYTSMAAMQKMQPEMMKIQKQYSGDKMRLQQEMMKLYQSHKTSPMSGCLPMLLQIPIFFALYKALIISVPMRQADFLWISDLAAMDPYFILPVLMGATMWWQQRISTPAVATAAPGMGFMKWMPVVFTAMFAWMPAGLVLYWTVSNLFGIMQIKIIKK
jgi:YidC/Oxa1 family membrane protein insertase